MIEYLELASLVGIVELDLAARRRYRRGEIDDPDHRDGLARDRGPPQGRRGDRLHRGDGEPGRYTRTLVDLRRFANRASESADHLEQMRWDEGSGQIGGVPQHRRLLRDKLQLVVQVERIVRAHLGTEPVLERGDDPASVGV